MASASLRSCVSRLSRRGSAQRLASCLALATDKAANLSLTCDDHDRRQGSTCWSHDCNAATGNPITSSGESLLPPLNSTVHLSRPQDFSVFRTNSRESLTSSGFFLRSFSVSKNGEGFDEGSEEEGRPPQLDPEELETDLSEDETGEELDYYEETVEVETSTVRVAPLPDDIPTPEPTEAAPKASRSEPSRKERRAAAEATAAEEENIPFPRFKTGTAVTIPGTGKKRSGRDKKGALLVEEFPLMEAIKRVKAGAKAKFDETVEFHVKLGVDPKRSDMTVRGSAILPQGSGKSSRVAVFAEGPKAEEARAAGADVVGAGDLIQKIKESGGKLDFDKCIAIPPLMPQLTQVARILGPRGMMPNPKMGTVTMNVAEAVAMAKRGKADFRADKSGNVHCGVGKVSFSDDALRDNVTAVAAALLAAKPVGLKKTSKFSGYFTTVTLTSTMGQGVRTSVPSLSAAVDAYARTDAGA